MTPGFGATLSVTGFALGPLLFPGQREWRGIGIRIRSLFGFQHKMVALVAVNEVFAGLAAWDGLFKDVGGGGFVGRFGECGFYAEQGTEFADEGLDVGAFGCAGGGPAG